MENGDKLICMSCKGMSHDLTLTDLKEIGKSLKYTIVKGYKTEYLINELNRLAFCYYDWGQCYPLIRYFLNCEKDENILSIDDFGWWEDEETEESKLGRLHDNGESKTLWFSDIGPSLTIVNTTLNNKEFVLVSYRDSGYTALYFTRELAKELNLEFSEEELYDKDFKVSYTLKDLKYALKFIEKNLSFEPENSLDLLDLDFLPKTMVRRFREYYIKCLNGEDILEYFNEETIPEFISKNCYQAREKLIKYLSKNFGIKIDDCDDSSYNSFDN